MSDRRETMVGFVASQKIEKDGYFLIPDYRDDVDADSYNEVEVESDDDNTMIRIPAHFEVCPTCGGKGKHVNPSIDSNGLTASDFDEFGEDFREDYFSGQYDVRCNECDGNRVVLVENESLNEQQRAALGAYNKALYEEGREIKGCLL